MGREKEFLAYMNDKYGCEFTWVSKESGPAGSGISYGYLESDDFPGQKVLVRRYGGEDGINYYCDNYMAFLFHEEAGRAIRDVISRTLTDYDFFFAVPQVALDRDPGNGYDVEAYLADPVNHIAVAVIAYEKGGRQEFEQIAENLRQRHIRLEGALVFAEDQERVITEENLQEYLIRTGWYQKKVNFSIDENGVCYEDWR